MIQLLNYFRIPVFLCVIPAVLLCVHPSPVSTPPPAIVQPPAETATGFIRVDARTTATGRYFKLDSAYIYPDSAKLFWWDYYSNGDAQLLQWGTDSNNYTTTINLQPFIPKIRHQTTIAPLTPDIQYYVRFYRPYIRENKWDCCFSFITPPLPQE